MRVTDFRRFKASYHLRAYLSHLSIQYVNQSESLYLDHFPICCETNGISKESTYADNMKLYTAENFTIRYQTHVTEVVKDICDN